MSKEHLPPDLDFRYLLDVIKQMGSQDIGSPNLDEIEFENPFADLERRIAKLQALVFAIMEQLTPAQAARIPAAYERILTEHQMRIVSSNPPKENSQE